MGDAQRTNNAAAPRRGAINTVVQPRGAPNTVIQLCGATLSAMPRRGAIILCGGHSRRFGKPKEWLTIDGETLLGRTVRVLRGCVDEIVLAARSGQSLPPVDGVEQFPPAVGVASPSPPAVLGADQSPPAASGLDRFHPTVNGAVDRVDDEVPDAGPIAGIVAGMRHLAARCPVIFVTACDHPRLDPQFVDCLLRQLDASDAGLIPSYRGQLFPLTAVYRSSMFIHFRDALAAGERSVQRVATRAGARVLVVDDHPSFRQEFVQQSLLNVNDLATWASIG